MVEVRDVEASKRLTASDEPKIIVVGQRHGDRWTGGPPPGALPGGADQLRRARRIPGAGDPGPGPAGWRPRAEDARPLRAGARGDRQPARLQRACGRGRAGGMASDREPTARRASSWCMASSARRGSSPAGSRTSWTGPPSSRSWTRPCACSAPAGRSAGPVVASRQRHLRLVRCALATRLSRPDVAVRALGVVEPILPASCVVGGMTVPRDESRDWEDPMIQRSRIALLTAVMLAITLVDLRVRQHCPNAKPATPPPASVAPTAEPTTAVASQPALASPTTEPTRRRPRAAVAPTLAADPRAHARADARADAAADARPTPRADARADAGADPRADAAADARADARRRRPRRRCRRRPSRRCRRPPSRRSAADAAADARADARADAAADARADAAADPRADAAADPRADAAADPRADARRRRRRRPPSRRCRRRPSRRPSRRCRRPPRRRRAPTPSRRCRRPPSRRCRRRPTDAAADARADAAADPRADASPRRSPRQRGPRDARRRAGPAGQDQGGRCHPGQHRAQLHALLLPEPRRDVGRLQRRRRQGDRASDWASTVEFEAPSFDLVVAGSWNDRWDMSVGSVTITEPRKDVLDFTQPYAFNPAQMAATTASGITTLDGLAGQAICVGGGTTYQQWLEGTLALVDAPDARDAAGGRDGLPARDRPAVRPERPVRPRRLHGLAVQLRGDRRRPQGGHADGRWSVTRCSTSRSASPSTTRSRTTTRWSPRWTRSSARCTTDGTLLALSKKWFDGLDLVTGQ